MKSTLSLATTIRLSSRPFFHTTTTIPRFCFSDQIKQQSPSISESDDEDQHPTSADTSSSSSSSTRRKQRSQRFFSTVSYIKHIPEVVCKDDEYMKEIYQIINTIENRSKNLMISQTLCPHLLDSHISFRDALFHDKTNRLLDPWQQNLIGLYVSNLNRCLYSFNYFHAMLCELLDETRADFYRELCATSQLNLLEQQEHAMLFYARKLTKTPTLVNDMDIAMLRQSGLHDGHILELNQIVSYVAYLNRTALGLGVHLEKTKANDGEEDAGGEVDDENS